LWALTKPLLDANTDLGAIDPLMVETSTIFSSALVTCALDVKIVSGASAIASESTNNLFI
jgi:hypothetical protein